MITINTQLTQQQIDQVKNIIGKHHGHTYYRDDKDDNAMIQFAVIPQQIKV